MTLVDSRPGIHAALTAYRAETGVPIDVDAVVGRLGPPLQGELEPYVGAGGVDEALRVFRRHMAEVGVQQAIPLPGAVAALEGVARHGGRSLVITAKHEPLAVATLEHSGLRADVVAGDVWGPAKADPLRDHHAVGYVGDHTGDVAAAREAGVVSVAVTTGHLGADELAAADHVLSSLEQLPPLLAAWAAES